MPLDEVTKARLKTILDAKKGRNTLMGLDTNCGMVGFDFVQDMGSDIPKASVSPSGYLRYVREDGQTQYLAGEGNFIVISRSWTREEHTPTFPWVRLKYCPEWVREELSRRWPSRKIAAEKYHGPERASVWETSPVFPLDVVVAWLRFIWPAVREWGERARKYLHCYTEGWVQTYPGIGAVLRTHDVEAEVIGYTDLEIILNGSGGKGWLNRRTEKWEVVG